MKLVIEKYDRLIIHILKSKMYILRFMQFYSKDIETFKLNIETMMTTTNSDDDQSLTPPPSIHIDLLDYDNQKERELLELFICKYIETKDYNILEELHRLCECELIFNELWSFDRNEFYRKTMSFDLNSVFGSSFLHEFVKQIQHGNLDYFDDLVAICSIKYFKTPIKAEQYFDSLIDRVRNIPGLDLTSTLKQKETFKQIFKKHKSMYTCC